jgi:hypothetical protein
MNFINIKKILRAQSENTATLEKFIVQEFITDIVKSK